MHRVITQGVPKGSSQDSKALEHLCRHFSKLLGNTGSDLPIEPEGRKTRRNNTRYGDSDIMIQFFTKTAIKNPNHDMP